MLSKCRRVKVVVIGLGSVENARRFAQVLGFPFDLLHAGAHDAPCLCHCSSSEVCMSEFSHHACMSRKFAKEIILILCERCRQHRRYVPSAWFLSRLCAKRRCQPLPETPPHAYGHWKPRHHPRGECPRHMTRSQKSSLQLAGRRFCQLAG